MIIDCVYFSSKNLPFNCESLATCWGDTADEGADTAALSLLKAIAFVDKSLMLKSPLWALHTYTGQHIELHWFDED